MTNPHSFRCKYAATTAFAVMLLLLSRPCLASGAQSGSATVHIQVIVASTVHASTAAPVRPSQDLSSNQGVVYNLEPISGQSFAKVSREEFQGDASPEEFTLPDSSVVVEVVTIDED